MLYLNVYLVLINLASIIIIRKDKQYARKKKRRIPEKTLFSFALSGGSLGILLGMVFYRHKTKHPTFTIVIPFLMVAHIIFYLFLRSFCD